MQTEAYELQKHSEFEMRIFQKLLGLAIRALIIDVGVLHRSVTSSGKKFKC